MNEHLDYFYAATINKSNPGGSGNRHAAVMYRGEDQMGSTKCHIFNPGNHSPIGLINLSRQRDTAGWNWNLPRLFLGLINIPANM